MRYLAVFTLLLFLAASCNEKMLKRNYGIKFHTHLQDEQIIEYTQKMGLGKFNLYKLDTSFYSYLYRFDETYTFKRENHLHPLQAIFYNSKGEMISFLSGSFADAGLFNLKWGKKEIYHSRFPPQSQTPVDDMLPLDSLRNFIGPLKVSDTSSSSKKFTVVVFVADFTGRQLERFLRFLDVSKLQQDVHGGVDVMVVAADNFYPEDRRK